MQTKRKAIARRIWDDVWQGNLDAADEIFDDAFVSHGLGVELPPGPEPFKQYVASFLNAFPDGTFTIEDEIAEGDKVTTRYTSRGTHLDTLMGIPATGKEVEVTGMNICRFEGDKIVEVWSNWDAMGMLQQLGVLPELA